MLIGTSDLRFKKVKLSTFGVRRSNVDAELDLEAWRRHQFQPLRSSRYSSCDLFRPPITLAFDLVTPKLTILCPAPRTTCTNLYQNDLVVPSAETSWNSLPAQLRNNQRSVESFRRQLKTELYFSLGRLWRPDISVRIENERRTRKQYASSPRPCNTGQWRIQRGEGTRGPCPPPRSPRPDFAIAKVCIIQGWKTRF